MGKKRNLNNEDQIKFAFTEQPRLNPAFNFEYYIEDTSNTFALNIAKEIAKNQSLIYNPVYFYGKSGTGKTHLVQAISNHLNIYYHHLNVRYFKANQFRNKYIESIKNKTAIPFREKFRKIDVLTMENIEILSNSLKTQEELFHAINAILHKKRQIIITSKLPPIQLKGFMERLVNRFSQGLVVEIDIPTKKLQKKIINRICNNSHFKIKKELIDYIADRVPDNIKTIESMVNKVIAYFSITKEKPVESILEKVFDKINLSDDMLTVKDIQIAVCSYYSITLEDILAASNIKRINLAKHIAMFLSRDLTNYTLKKIAIDFGGVSNSTISTAYRKIKKMLATDEKLVKEVEKIITNIKKR